MKTNETGRSMVEMLGVLAIIGVLSVAGIAGYTTAMKKNKVNTAISEISMAVIIAKTSNGGEGLTSSTDCANLTDLLTNEKVITGGKVCGGATVYEVKSPVGNGVTTDDIKEVAPTDNTTSNAKRAGYYVTSASAA